MKLSRFWAVFVIAVLVLSSLAGLTAFYLMAPSSHAPPDNRQGLNPDQIVINAGSTQTTCVDVTTCGLTSLSIANDSVVLVGISDYADVAPSAVAVVGGASGTCTAAQLDEGTVSSTHPLSVVDGCVDKTAALAAGHVYVNMSSAEYYDIYFIDFENSVITSSYYTAGTGTDGATTTATCATTATSEPSEIFEVGGWKTTAESTIAEDTSGFTAMTKEATTTNVVTANAQYGQDTVTTSFTATLLASSSADWGSACVAVYPAVVPSAPTSLTLGTATSSTMPVTWTDPAGEPTLIGAEVWEATWSGSCGSYSKNIAASKPYNSATATGTSGTYYCLEVDIENTTGWSSNSTALTDVGPLAAPVAPTLLTAVAQGGTTTQVGLSWTPATGQTLTNQTLYYWSGSSCSGAATAVNIADPTTTQYIQGSLTAATQYAFEVRDWDSSGQGAAPACTTATTFGTPTAVTGLSDTATTEFSVALAWTNPSGTGYTTIYNDTVYYTTGACGTYGNAINLGGAASAYNVTGLSPYTTYCFTVQAWSGGAGGSLATGLSVQTLAGIPGQPTNFRETSITGTTISFAWTNPAALTGALTNVTLFYITGSSCTADITGSHGHPGAGMSTISLNGTISTSYTFTGLTVNTQYCFSNALWTQGGQGINSTALVETTNGPAPSAPTNLQYVSASHTSVTMTWTQSAGIIVNDTVYYTTTSGCTGALTAVSEGVATSATVGSLSAATTYYWEVTAWSNGGQSPDSSCVTGATQSATPTPPIDLVSVNVGATFDYITWTNPSGYSITDNNVYYSAGVAPPSSPSCTGFPNDQNLGGVYSNYEITSLTSGDNYCIEVTVTDAQSNFSLPLYITTLTPPSNNSGPVFIMPASEWGTVLVFIGIIGGVTALFLVVRKRRNA
jgi:hypothetical protein